MTPTNGIAAKLDSLGRDINRLWEEKASKESVTNVTQDVLEVKQSIDGLRNSFGSLMKAILVACVVWALGSAGFLIGVLSLTQNQ